MSMLCYRTAVCFFTSMLIHFIRNTHIPLKVNTLYFLKIIFYFFLIYIYSYIFLTVRERTNIRTRFCWTPPSSSRLGKTMFDNFVFRVSFIQKDLNKLGEHRVLLNPVSAIRKANGQEILRDFSVKPMWVMYLPPAHLAEWVGLLDNAKANGMRFTISGAVANIAVRDVGMATDGSKSQDLVVKFTGKVDKTVVKATPSAPPAEF